MAAGFTVGRSRAIDAVDTAAAPWRVQFKRYLAPLDLQPNEQACLALLEQPLRLARLAELLRRAPADCIALLERMAEIARTTTGAIATC